MRIRRAAVVAAVALAATPAAAPAAAPADRVASARPSRDLDGDGVPDVVTEEVGAAGDESVACRSGADGRLIAATPRPAGVLLWPADHTWDRVLFVYPDGPSTVVAWVERCRERWRRTFTAAAGAPAAPARFGGFLTTRGRPDVLVETRSVRASVTDSTVHVLSGEDGRTRSESTTRFLAETPEATALPNLTGDGRGDYGYAVRANAQVTGVAPAHRLDAYDVTDGRALWSAELDVYLSRQVAIDVDADRDGVGDVLVSSRDPGDPTSALVDGASGEVRWVRDGLHPADLAPPGRTALLRLYRVYVAGEDVVMEVSLLDAAGTARSRWRHRLGPSGGHTHYDATSRRLGDVDGDGVEDVAYRARVEYEDAARRTLHVVMSGGTGAVHVSTARPLVAAGAAPGAGSFDGSGDDVWTPSPGRPALRDGRTGATVARWSTGEPLVQATVTSLDADRCPDVLMLTGSETRPERLVAVSGATGRARWAVPAYPRLPARALDQAAPGCGRDTVTPPPRRPDQHVPATGGPAAWPAAALVAAALIAARAARRVPPGRRLAASYLNGSSRSPVYGSHPIPRM